MGAGSDSDEGREARADWKLVFLLFPLLGFLGILLIVLDHRLQENKYMMWAMIARETGVVMVSTCMLGLLYEIFLRKGFLANMRAVFRKELRTEIPESTTHLKASGIVDCFPKLNYDALTNLLKDVPRNSEIFIQDIYFSHLQNWELVLANLIREKKVKVKILLLSVGSDAIAKRIEDFPRVTVDDFKNNIEQNYRVYERVRDRLSEADKELIELKTHNNFVSISLYGISGQLFVGLYLVDRTSTQGTMFKVIQKKPDVSSTEKGFYEELLFHFNHHWGRAQTYHAISAPVAPVGAWCTGSVTVFDALTNSGRIKGPGGEIFTFAASDLSFHTQLASNSTEIRFKPQVALPGSSERRADSIIEPGVEVSGTATRGSRAGEWSIVARDPNGRQFEIPIKDDEINFRQGDRIQARVRFNEKNDLFAVYAERPPLGSPTVD